MKDQVQQNRRNQSDGSYGTPLTDSGGGGGGVMSTGGEDVMKIRPLSVEAVELPLSKAGGGGGVHGGSGGSQAALNERRGTDFSPTQWATGCWKHRSRESSRDVECIRPRCKSWTVCLWRRQSAWNRY